LLFFTTLLMLKMNDRDGRFFDAATIGLLKAGQ
jgi:hypothetical protein